MVKAEGTLGEETLIREKREEEPWRIDWSRWCWWRRWSKIRNELEMEVVR